MYAVLSKLDRHKFVRLGAGIVISAFVLAASAAIHPALQSSNPAPFDASYLEPAALIYDSLHAVRQDTAIKSNSKYRRYSGWKPNQSGEVAAKWRAVEADIDEEQQVLARCRRKEACPAVAKGPWISWLKAPATRIAPVLINRAVDLAITRASDEAQLGVADHWSPPFETLRTHCGDCENYRGMFESRSHW